MGLGGAGSKSPGRREVLGPGSRHRHPHGDEMARADHALEPTQPRDPPVAATHQLPGLLAALCPGQGAPVDMSLGGSPGLTGSSLQGGRGREAGACRFHLGLWEPLDTRGYCSQEAT